MTVETLYVNDRRRTQADPNKENIEINNLGNSWSGRKKVHGSATSTKDYIIRV